MSLLLEALKKAELAKQAAKEAPPASDAPPPFTRDQLPDITQPMEIHSEDLTLVDPRPAAKSADKPVLELALEEHTPPEPAAATPASPPRAASAGISYSHAGEVSYSPSAESVERKQAQQFFEAKELDVNPRMPFYITVGALGLFALGTVGYFWYQLQPRSTFMVPPASSKAAAPPLASAPAALPETRTTTAQTPPAATPPAELAAAIPARRAAEPAAAAIAPTPARPRTVFQRQTATSPATDAAARQPDTTRRESNITITPSRVQSDPVLESAFAAFNAGDLARARADYQQVLRYSPDNRDALLGLAAVETQAGRNDAAERFFLRLLELDPRDAYAQAGLIGLRGQVDPLAAESRLKNMIASQPGVSFLHFILGNQYAAQGRWAEAQQAYFQAYTIDPEQSDFSYNLAVSLDRMHQAKQALEYYRRALALAGDHPVSFDKAKTSKRVLQLDR